MARLVGIDISQTHVRAVAITTSYRRVAIERMVEVEISQIGDLAAAVRHVAKPLVLHGESVAIAIDGSNSYVQHIELPSTAVQKLEQVVPFELEARVPADIDELVHDYVVVRRKSKDQAVRVLVAAAPVDRVRAAIDTVKGELGREVERVGCGPLPLANLVGHLGPEILASGPVAVIDLGSRRMDVLVVEEGQVVFARTVAIGITALPDGASQIAASIRQTLIAYAASGGVSVTTIYLTGEGANVAGAEAYLSTEVRSSVIGLPIPQGIDVAESERANIPRFMKALGVALGLGSRPKDPDLRRGPLAFQRGYAFLKEKAPLLSGLATAFVISVMFSTWAEMRGLDKQHEVLAAQLANVTRTVLGQEVSEPEAAMELLQKKRSSDEADPMPYMDAFDVVVEISKAVPEQITHDIEEFDMQKERVKLTGIVGSAAEAQEIVSKLKEHRCFQELRLGKVTQVVNSDRQKYGVEWDVRCPEDQASKAKKKTEKPERTEKPEASAGGQK
ncbi:MAG: pilus assembly protein PilM [Polyangiaceae bacterium]